MPLGVPYLTIVTMHTVQTLKERQVERRAKDDPTLWKLRRAHGVKGLSLANCWGQLGLSLLNPLL
jgi:hypothetical protein